MKAIVLVGLLACGCQPHTSSSEPADVTVAKSSLARASDPSSADVAALGGSNRAFAFDLYHQIAQTSSGENIVFSPYSLSTAFAMTYAGARNVSRDQIAAVMHFDLPQPQLHEAFNATEQALPTLLADDQPVQLALNNALWMANGAPVEKPFLDTLALNYGAGVSLFHGDPEATRLAINAQISEETAMLIPELLPEGAIDSLTRFVLTDTVYLNAKWQTPFEADEARDGTFTKLDGSSVTATMMHTAQLCAYASGDGYQAIALSYAGGSSLQFIAVLPDEGNFAGLEAGLDRDWFDALTAQLSEDGVAIGLPRFDFAQHVSMKSELQALGMSD
ncbi:MAG TPA: serpin family protein, partial [Polyangiales bacterium]